MLIKKTVWKGWYGLVFFYRFINMTVRYDKSTNIVAITNRKRVYIGFLVASNT